MATLTGAVSRPQRYFVTLPVSVRVPLLAMSWVFVNVLLVRLGFRTGYQVTCGLLAGAIDGSIAASILLATLGDKLQAGTTGLLGGYGLHDALSKFGSSKQYLIWIHDHSEKALLVLLGQDEDFHEAVQAEVLWLAATAAIVILLTLLVQLIRNGGRQASRKPLTVCLFLRRLLAGATFQLAGQMAPLRRLLCLKFSEKPPPARALLPSRRFAKLRRAPYTQSCNTNSLLHG
jgi:hypothetical protein